MGKIWGFGTMTIAALLAAACGAEMGEGDETVAEDLEVGQTEQALSYGDHGFAWVNISNGPVNTTYSYTTGGGSISVSSSGTGLYTVSFGGLAGPGGNAQAVAYGTSSTRCKVQGWSSSGSNLNVSVRCHTPSGALANSAFVVQYGRRDGGFDGRGAYVWANNATLSSYIPDTGYSWNSTGGTNTITRTGTGAYDVYLPGLAGGDGSVQVTAYGTGSEHCKVLSWGPSGSSQRVSVRCYTTSGVAVNTLFALNFGDHQEVSAFDYGAYAWANSSTLASYVPPASYSYNSGTINGWPGCGGWIGSNSAGRYSTGRYFMRHTLLDHTQSAPHVTAYGGGSSYCKVEGWSAWGDGTEVRTRCFSASGAAANSQYIETYSTSYVRGPC